MSTFTKVLSVLAVGGSGYLAGFMWSITALTVPLLPHASARIAVKQWNDLYYRGAAIAPPFGMALALAFAYLSYASGLGHGSPKGVAFVIAAVFAGLNVPFTLAVMLSTNSALMKLGKESELTALEVEEDAVKSAEREVEVRVLVKRWGWLNVVRSLLPTTAALVGGAAAVGLI